MTPRYLQMLWRAAVLEHHKRRCAVCGLIKSEDQLECHHLVKRRYRVLRNDYRNGVPACVGECHNYADTSVGTAQILVKHEFADYLIGRMKQFKTIKDYRMWRGISQKEHEKEEADELKRVARGEGKC